MVVGGVGRARERMSSGVCRKTEWERGSVSRREEALISATRLHLHPRLGRLLAGGSIGAEGFDHALELGLELRVVLLPTGEIGGQPCDSNGSLKGVFMERKDVRT